MIAKKIKILAGIKVAIQVGQRDLSLFTTSIIIT